jgi:hypothetical protein
MKKFMFVLLAVGLIALTLVPTACKKAETPTEYSTSSVGGTSFSYPTDWTDETASLEQGIAEGDPNYKDYITAKGWDNPSVSAILVAIAINLDNIPNTSMPSVLTTEMKKGFAAGFGGGFIGSLADQYSVTSQQESSADGEWAWQIEFTGKINGADAKGYLLTVFHERTAFILAYVVKNKDWGTLGGVYNTVKGSVNFQ